MLRVPLIVECDYCEAKDMGSAPLTPDSFQIEITHGFFNRHEFVFGVMDDLRLPDGWTHSRMDGVSVACPACCDRIYNRKG